MNNLTVVMYHYVRPLGEGPFRLSGLDVKLFEEQIDYLTQHYTIVSGDDVRAAIDGSDVLPERAALLTFDDGYKDHYIHVYPSLAKRSLPGVFFVPSSVIVERKVLDVNKVHFVLASKADVSSLGKFVDNEIRAAIKTEALSSVQDYRRKYCQENRFDLAETIYVKRMLQFVLPAPMRARLTNQLFEEWVTSDEAAFAEELYLSEAECHDMISGCMEIGSHTHNHPWLNTCSASDQRSELETSLAFLDRIGARRERFSCAYPYGAYNANTLELLDDLGCGFAVTTVPQRAHVSAQTRLILPRLDTNDLPKSHLAPAPDWVN